MPTYNCYTSLSCLTFKSVITPTKSEAASKSKGDDFILKLDEIKDNSDNEEQEQKEETSICEVVQGLLWK